MSAKKGRKPKKSLLPNIFILPPKQSHGKIHEHLRRKLNYSRHTYHRPITERNLRIYQNSFGSPLSPTSPPSRSSVDSTIISPGLTTKISLTSGSLKNKAGHLKWTWKFRASDMDSDSGLLECIGAIGVQCESHSETVDSHVIRYKMTRVVIAYGSDCYDDCRPCEIEEAEEHFDGEFEYNMSGEIVIGYGLSDVDEINNQALDSAKKLIDEDFSNMGDVDIIQEPCKQLKFPHNKPVVFRKILSTVGREGFYKWEWNFTADEKEYGCTLECKGSIDIVPQKVCNPKIPKTTKKRRLLGMAMPQKTRTKITHMNI